MGDFDNKDNIKLLRELNRRLLLCIKDVSTIGSIACIIVFFGQYLLYTYYEFNNGMYKTGPSKVRKESIIFAQVAYLRNAFIHLESADSFIDICNDLRQSLSLYVYGSYEFEDTYIKLLSTIDWDSFIDYCTCGDFSKYEPKEPEKDLLSELLGSSDKM